MSSERDDRRVEPGDLVYLSIRTTSPDGSTATPDMLGLQSNVPVLVGAGRLPQGLERRLVDRQVGDEGQVELRPDGIVENPTPLSEVVHNPNLAKIIKESGVTSAWELLAADPETLAERLLAGPDDVSQLQVNVASQLTGRLVQFRIVGVYRWRDDEEDGEMTTEHDVRSTVDDRDSRTAGTARSDGPSTRQSPSSDDGEDPDARNLPASDGEVSLTDVYEVDRREAALQELRDQGLETAQDLAAADPKELVERTALGIDTAAELVSAARDHPATEPVTPAQKYLDVGNRPVSALVGVNNGVESQLRERGIHTIADLAAADPYTLQTETSIPLGTALSLVSRARSAEGPPVTTIQGIGPAYAERLQQAGVIFTSDLAEADAGVLSGKISVSESRVERWIDRAQTELSDESEADD